MILDLHNDYPTAIDISRYDNYIKQCGNADALAIAVIWTSEFADRAIDKVAEKFEALVKIKRDLPVAVEDIGFLAEERHLRDFDFSEYIYCSLTWNINNGFAGGALDDGELTSLGKRAIRLMNDRGCYLDLAHLNRRSFYQALDSAKYALCSHTGFNDHLRSLNDSQIRAMVERKCVIGLCTVNKFTDAYCARDFETVIDGFVQKYGVDCLAIGTDFNGSTDIPEDLSDYYKIAALYDGLRERGYAAQDIDKIFFTNANRIVRREITE